jgi:photosystem II stability/assembly factor-like uncharacterized protein
MLRAKRAEIKMRIALVLAAWCCGVFFAAQAKAQVFRPLGPEGGDVLSLGQDPANPLHVYLGTADGHVFGSDDGGEHWELRGRAGVRLDSVVTAILADPRGSGTLYAATWTRDAAAGGGVFRSDDAGRTWAAAGLAGEAVRALAIEASASNVMTLVAGTLDGVYRSRDSGKTWERISPAGDLELRNLDSVAIDPADPNVIYAGTFHLPWKTTDGGLHWSPIHTGMIDDSDVMSMLPDRTTPGRVYASACSGIYRSDTRGEVWQKVQGIPYTARRTVEILKDPARPQIVFAATTEGLWKTTDGGSTWQRITPPDWSVTAMIVGAGVPDRIVIGVQQRGILASDDGGSNFHEANGGFFHRQILAAAAAPAGSGGFLIALANAPDFLFETDSARDSWRPLGDGPTQATLGAIYASPDGWWAALAGGGLERYDESKSAWVRAGRLLESPLAKAGAHGAKPAVRKPPAPLVAVVEDVAFAEDRWYAATPAGLLVSGDHGSDWSAARIGALAKLPIESVWVSGDGGKLCVASLISIACSEDRGANWKWVDVPAAIGSIRQLEVSSGRAGDAAGSAATLLVRTDRGLFISRDAGATWDAAGHGLPEAPVQNLATVGPVFLAAMKFGGLYLSRDSGRNWERLSGVPAEGYFAALVGAPNSSWPAATVTFYAASATEGLYAIDIAPQPDFVPEGDTKH